MFITISIALMVAWMFLYLTVHLPTYLSCTMLVPAFSLFALDWWMHSRQPGQRGSSGRSSAGIS